MPVALMHLGNLLSVRGGWGTSLKKKGFLCDVFISIPHMPFPLVLDTGLYFRGFTFGHLKQKASSNLKAELGRTSSSQHLLGFRTLIV